MDQTIRRLVALLPAFAMVAGLALAAPSTAARDRITEICVIGGQFDYCVPYDR
jgi:hypothetical protein